MSIDRSVLIRGGGDLATGVAIRLHHAGAKVLITELAQPLAVRRTVSFAEAVYEGIHTVEGIRSRLVDTNQLSTWNEGGEIPVLIDPNADIITKFGFQVVVDARLTKQAPAPLPSEIPLHIGLGPGFHAGKNCHAVIETRRSHTLGRVIWNGTTQPDSGLPEGNPDRVLRASGDGRLIAHVNIGELLEKNQPVAEIHLSKDGSISMIQSPFKGVLRGLIRDGLDVYKGLKIGDVDARGDVTACFLVSDKSFAVGGGVLEAIMTHPEIRKAVFF